MTTRTAAELAAALEVLEVPSAEVLDWRIPHEIEREAHALGLTDLEMRAKLVRARALVDLDEPTAVAGLLWEVHEWATESGNQAQLAASHRKLVAVYSTTDPATALDHAVRAVELIDEATPRRVHAEYLSVLAMALGVVGSYDAARERFREAEQILNSADGVSDANGVFLLMNVLNNLTYNEHLAGDHEQA